MITNYEKQIALQNAGYDADYLESLSGSKLTGLWLDEIAKQDLIFWVKQKGEDDGVCHILSFDKSFNNACNIISGKDRLTDILSLYVSKNLEGGDSLSVLVSTPDDTMSLFVDITDFNCDVIDRIYDYAQNFK